MVQVTISDGVLEGKTVEDELVTYHSFKGIPYAAPPVADLRFKPPQPVQPWTNVRSAKELGSPCYQYDIMTSNIGGSEDCLYLNVYTPNLKPNKPLPVMFWIHGGGFMSGSGNDDIYGPEFLIRQGVILVTFNYRLEVLGFLCLDSKEVPGNVGMKDQVAALKWVQKNISNFGGDPKNVTIFGESAGGASVCGHLQSPMSKGLFKRAIAQSGTTTNWWSHPWGGRESALSLARKLDFFSEDPQELYEFFKALPPEKMVYIKEPFTLYDCARGFGDLRFGMTCERNFGQERFLVDDFNSFDQLREGVHEGVEVIVGYTEDEGIFWAKLGADLTDLFDKLKRFDDLLVPRPILLNLPQSNRSAVGRKFRKYYFGDNNFEVTNENVLKLFRYYSLDMFIYGVNQWAKILSSTKKNKTYLYKFTAKSERNFMTHIFQLRQYLGDKTVVSHADDLPYLFPMRVSGFKVDKDSEAFKLIDRVTKLWTNFAKFGNPTPDDSLGATWKPYDVESQQYLDIGNQLEAASSPDKEELEFWEQVFQEHYPRCVY